VFAATFAEHYPFFLEKRTDWAAVVTANRAKVNSATTPADLFTTLSGMILPLGDAHTGLVAQNLARSVRPVRRTASFVPPAERPAAYKLADRYLAAPLQPFCQGQIEFGMIGTNIGYLRIRSFASYSQTGTFEADTAELGAALDTIFAGAAAWKGLVLDVRLNTGGADPLGLLIAGRLTAATYTAYAKQARNDPADPTKWTAAQTSLVQATTRPGFRGPVIELIGVQSVSAAETFTQALLGRQPKITRLGENTQGVFSDVLERRLPNGWIFGLPNERFVTDGKNYDVVGIAPDIPLESLTPEARATGKDAAIERAVAMLLGK
jgi:C-terminal processing protease CtpA/Prc